MGIGKINHERMRKDQEEAQQGGPSYNWTVGDTNTYMLPPPEGYEVPYAEYAIHRVGPSGQTVLCFNPKKNKILTNAKFLAFAAERGIKIPKVCPMCAEIDAEDLWVKNKDLAIKKSAKMRGVFLIIPWEKRGSSKEDWSNISPKRVWPYFAAKDQWDQICDWSTEMFDKETQKDVTDFGQARFFRLSREGTGNNTRYSAAGDSQTTQKPVALDKPTQATILKALDDPMNCYERLVAYHVLKDPEEVAALMQGVATDKVEDEGAGETEAEKPCRGNPEMFNASDPECSRLCKLFKDCQAEVEAKLGAGKKGKATKAPEPEPEAQPEEPPAEEAAAPEEPEVAFEDLPFTGTLCSMCSPPQPQRQGPTGPLCPNGHVNAPAWQPPAKPAAPPKTSAPPSAAAPTAAAAGNSQKLDQLLAQRGRKPAPAGK